MTKTIGFALLAATALGLAACNSESSENRSAQEAAEPQNTDYVGDIGPATQEAVSDTQAAIDEASGQADQETKQAARKATQDANAAVDQAGQELKQP